jgi:hypothetical protein
VSHHVSVYSLLRINVFASVFPATSSLKLDADPKEEGHHRYESEQRSAKDHAGHDESREECANLQAI